LNGRVSSASRRMARYLSFAAEAWMPESNFFVLHLVPGVGVGFWPMGVGAARVGVG